MEKFEEDIKKAQIERAQNIAKSFQSSDEDSIQKGKSATVGEIREWGGKKYKKQPNGKWMEVSRHKMTRKEHEAMHKLITDNPTEEEKQSTHYRGQVKLHQNALDKLSDKEYDESELSGEKSDEKKRDFNDFLKKYGGKLSNDKEVKDRTIISFDSDESFDRAKKEFYSNNYFGKESVVFDSNVNRIYYR